MDEEKTVGSEEAIATETVEQQPETVPYADYTSIKAELEQEKLIRLSHERGNSKLADEMRSIKSVAAKWDSFEEIYKLDRQLQTGAIDQESYNAKVGDIDKRRQTALYQEQITLTAGKVKEATFEALQEAGLDPNSNDPDVTALRDEFQQTIKSGGDINEIGYKAYKLALKKVKSAMPSDKDIEARVQEKLKQSPQMKVSTSSPEGISTSKQETIARYARGEGTHEEYLKAINS